jgi:broad specificity phosphatase PhoE
MGATPMVYLVRHAHAGRRSAWDGFDLARPLSEVGRRQAVGLVARLAGYPVGRILSSPADRCLQTVEPLARHRRLPVEVSKALGVEEPVADVLALLGDRRIEEAVLCTHGEVIARVFERLLAGGLELPVRPRWAKGSTWVLGHDDGRVYQASYLEPLSAC